MLAALSTNRNYTSCCDDLRPFIVSVDPTEPITTTGTVTTGIIQIEEINDLTVTTLTASTIVASSITTFEFTTTFISNFTVKSGDDVKFVGTTSNNFLLWDSSRDTLYLENSTLKTSECFIYLNNPSDENPLNNTFADRDNGILFKYFDNNLGIGATTEKLGFFGFKDDTERFTFIPNVSISGCIATSITEPKGDLDVKDIYLRNIVNEDISQDMGITSAADINMAADDLSINLTSGMTVNTASTVSFDVDGGDFNLDITGDFNIDVHDNDLDILVDGDIADTITVENIFGTIDIISGSTSAQAIHLNTASGGILLNNDSTTENIELNSAANIVLTTGTVITQIDETNGLTVNKRKTDYLQWIPYYKFDAFSGFWFSTRTTPSNPLHFWRKDATAETARIYADFEVSSRTTTDKGFQLTSIFFAYTIGTAAITSITPTITLKSFNPAVPGEGPTLLNITFTDVNLASGTAIGEHYRSVNITTPFFLISEGVINTEISIITASTSVFDFHGVHLKFDRNNT